ncbi:deoxyfructose oxidoreductase [Roseibium aquae]|uniref:Deoxyfructose oxidoreductase n=1 Tax=Roseibium aquae TaxID=1323746 RepID=A0A916X2G9_9HYPH|nr:Gfo/Idh/MocA family oxidoreductase [Roseibium aquae]GGB61638.1 deoxyfructose oxidoreductase [Roseibium aquae]
MGDASKVVRWGILSTAKIGREKVIPGIQNSKYGVAAAIASRDLGRAMETASALGIAKAYGSYDELLSDPDIDAIYNPLPNHLHVPLTLQAVEAGKHVLCEKPIALNAEEARRLMNLPEGRLVAEAFMVRAHPQWIRAREIVRSGALGELKVVQSFFSYFNSDPANIRNMADIGGGGLMDIGCYPIVAGRYFFEAEPKRAISLIDRDPQFGTDRVASALVDFGNGRRLDFTVATQLTPYQRIQLVGTEKRLEILIPYNAPGNEGMVLRLDDGSKFADAAAICETLPVSDQYAELTDIFALSFLGEIDPPYGPADALQNMKTLDALFASEKTGAWAEIE